jgi:1-deoxy-D-xylulose-5-phosphate synthase
MADGTGLAGFAREFPDRFFDVGIAEQHAVTLAAGMAAGGLRPVVAIYSTFMQRAYDQINHDVCLQKLPVVFALDRAGIVGEDGETHQGVFDIAYLAHLPNIALMAPSSAQELSEMLDLAIASRGPCAIRYPRGEAPPQRSSVPPVEWGRAAVARNGQDICIVSVGHCLNPCLEAAEALDRLGVSATVLNLRFVKPLDWDAIRRHALLTRALLVVEEGVGTGGAGSMIISKLAQEQAGRGIFFDSVAVPDAYIEHGAAQALRARHGLDAPGVADRAMALWRRRREGTGASLAGGDDTDDRKDAARFVAGREGSR